MFFFVASDDIKNTLKDLDNRRDLPPQTVKREKKPLVNS
jgi:hypothetical protein